MSRTSSSTAFAVRACWTTEAPPADIDVTVAGGSAGLLEGGGKAAGNEVEGLSRPCISIGLRA